MHIPQKLAETNYVNPANPSDTVFQSVYNTKDSIFEFVQKHPDMLRKFNTFMVLQHQGRIPWYDVYPIEEKLASGPQDPNRVILIDVGGGWGSQLFAARQRFPELKGRMILQDLPQATERVHYLPDFTYQFEVQSHNFFKEQPVKGINKFFLCILLTR